jgi:hypothetical protein
MKLNRPIYFTVAVVFLFVLNASAQKKKTQSPVKSKSAQGTTTKKKSPAPAKVAPSDPTQDERKVRDMMAFLGYMLNTLGSSETSARDKDVLVTESY